MNARMLSENSRDGYVRARLDDFAMQCRAGGLAVTLQRLSIIDALLGSTVHPRAAEIYADVRRTHPHISLATVHRTLETRSSHARNALPDWRDAQSNGAARQRPL
jgi:hypothetical protein